MPPWVSVAISVAFVVGIIIASLLWRREVRRREMLEQASASGQIPFTKLPTVLTEAERALYPVLVWAMGKEGTVLPKMSLGQLVTLPKGVERREFHLRVVGARIADFVICHTEGFTPLLAIMVGEEGSRKSDRAEDQNLAAGALRAAGLPILWLSPKTSYMPHEVKALIKEAINKHYNAAAAGAESPAGERVEADAARQPG